MEHWYRATAQHCAMQRGYGALLMLHLSIALVTTVDQGWEPSHQERLFLDTASTGCNEQQHCLLLLHFRFISNLESSQQYLEDVLQTSAHTASSSPQQVTGAYINDSLIVT
jgi:hypothetical protein